MVRARQQELEPSVAASRALDALLEAAKYSGYGARTYGQRLSRRAAVVGTEGARRAGGAWYVLRVGVPPRPRSRRIGRAVVFGMTAGAIAVVAVLGAVARLASTTSRDPAQSERGMFRPAAEPAAPPAEVVDPDGSVPMPAGTTASRAAQRTNDGG